MAKSSKPRKKIIPVILFAAIIIAVGAAVILFCAAKERYWNDTHLRDAILDLSEYDESIAENDADLDEIKLVVHKCNEKAAPVRDTLSPFFEGCNELIIRYFQDVYGVDVTEKLNTLQIMEATYPEDVSEMVGGSYTSDFPDSLFMNGALLDSFLSDTENGEIPGITSMEFSVKMLRTVYIHEVMHYLGFNSDSVFDHFTEAVAECLNKKVMQHSGIKYESLTGYSAIQGFAAQIVECDPELVREVLTGGSSRTGEHFNGRFEDRSGFNYAEYYDRLIGLIQKGDNKDSSRIAYYTQYLSYEYCKAANRNSREILKTANEPAVRLFEIKWLLGVYGKK